MARRLRRQAGFVIGYVMVGILLASPGSVSAGPGGAADDGARLLAERSYSFGFDPETGRVELAATVPASSFGDILSAFPGKIEFKTAEGFWRLSRSNDPEPHQGGAEIQSALGGCTSGFTVYKTSTGLQYMASAGHCGNLNGAITQPDTGFSFGTVKFKAGFPATDALLIGAEVMQGRIYTGGAAGVSKPVAGASNPVTGGQYCFSGSVTLETCGHVAGNIDKQICFPDGCTNHLVVMTGGIHATNGDSGGPVYINGSGSTTVYIRGIIVGGGIVGGQQQDYVHKWTTIRDAFGVTIVVP